jgi:hypothetical protein
MNYKPKNFQYGELITEEDLNNTQTVELIAISEEIPEGMKNGDNYYDINDNRIYTMINGGLNSGEVPVQGVPYINLNEKSLYFYNGSTLVLFGGGDVSRDYVDEQDAKKVNIESEDITGQTKNIIDMAKGFGSQGIGYKRWVCKTDGGSANISNRPVAANGSFVMEMRLNRWASDSDYRVDIIYWHKDTIRAYVAIVDQNTSSISWSQLAHTSDVVEAKKRHIMTIGLNGGAQVLPQATWTKVNLNSVVASVGDKLTMSSNGIKIGANVSHVLISANAVGNNMVSPFNLQIRKNSDEVALSMLSGYGNTTNQNQKITPILLSVKQNDIIYMYAYAGGTTSQISGATQRTNLTVEVVQ